jgi:hypothetical protein
MQGNFVEQDGYRSANSWLRTKQPLILTLMPSMICKNVNA